MSFLLGRTLPHEFILCPSKASKSLGDEKKLSINSLGPKPSTLWVKCLTVACVAVMSSVAECESLPKYTLMAHVYPASSHSFVTTDSGSNPDHDKLGRRKQANCI